MESMPSGGSVRRRQPANAFHLRLKIARKELPERVRDKAYLVCEGDVYGQHCVYVIEVTTA